MCDDASDGVCATGSFLLGGFAGGMGGFVGMILNHPAFGVFGGVTLGVLGVAAEVRLAAPAKQRGATRTFTQRQPSDVQRRDNTRRSAV